jgi:hypothetical protein
LWSQRLDGQPITQPDAALGFLPESSRIDLIRGGILETVAMRLLPPDLSSVGTIAHALNVTWSAPRNSRAARRRGEKIRHSIRLGRDDHHAKGQHGEIVLLFQSAIHRDEHIDSAASSF